MSKCKCVPLSENVEEMFIGPFGSSLKNECFVNENEAFCMVYEQKHAIQKTMNVETRYVNEKKYNELKRFNVQAGDIIVSCRGTIGETYIIPEGAPLGIMHPSIMKIRLKKDVYDKYFFNLLLKSRLKKHEKEANGSGVKMAISATELGKELFPVPTMAEQQKITKIISQVRCVIDKRKQELEYLDKLVKARFVEMFGNPFDVKTKVKWPIKTICDLSESIMDGSNVDKALYKQNGDVLFLRIQNVWCNEFKLEDSVYISEIENEEYKDTSLKHGDLLITKIGRYYTSDSSLGRVSVYLGDDDKANYSNNIMRIRFKDGINSEFINTLMNLDDYNKFIRRTSVGGTDKRALSKGLISSYPIIVPPSDKQNEFVDFLHQVDKSKFIYSHIT